MRLFIVICLIILDGLYHPALTAQSTFYKPRQNILIILVDDLAYSDLGAFGGEIRTPNLDELAHSGIIFSNFYAAPTCSPTRAMLLSGVDHHRAGLGSMAELMQPHQLGQPGYEGYLNNRVTSIADIMRKGGYHTYMTGKWHLGLDKGNSPAARGFEKSFALLQGGAGHFNDASLLGTPAKALYRRDGNMTNWPEGAYSTDFYTDEMIRYIREGKKVSPNKPFFAYLAYTAPHWPLQAPREVTETYLSTYIDGWDELRKHRLAGLKRMGFIDNIPDLQLPLEYRPWSTLTESEKRYEVKKMAIYAAMIELIDRNIGHLLDTLEEIGELDNTLILFLSDNGPEGAELAKSPLMEGWLEHFNNSYENMGLANSYIYLGANWASATAAPSWLYKSYTSEGGIKVPAILWHKQLPRAGQIEPALLFVTDIAPTITEFSGLKQLASKATATLNADFQGRSFVDLASNEKNSAPERQYAWELFGRKAVREGKWKAVKLPEPHGNGEWQLFNLSTDPGETKDLASIFPERLDKLKAQWDRYAHQNKLILPIGDGGY